MWECGHNKAAVALANKLVRSSLGDLGPRARIRRKLEFLGHALTADAAERLTNLSCKLRMKHSRS